MASVTEKTVYSDGFLVSGSLPTKLSASFCSLNTQGEGEGDREIGRGGGEGEGEREGGRRGEGEGERGRGRVYSCWPYKVGTPFLVTA